jgi:hypothetical protein
MRDREWCKKIEDEIIGLKNRVNKLKGNSSCSKPDSIELDIKFPEGSIKGLHFDAVRVKAVFELKEDGNYYSRDILFNSARDTDKGTNSDLLSEYLDSPVVKKAFIDALKLAGIETETISIFLPEKNQGVKKYNGVSWWYWLKPRYSGSSASFTYVNARGHSYHNYASSVGGCAPAFCVGDNRHE